MTRSVIKMNGNLFIRDGYVRQFLVDVGCPEETQEEFINYILDIHNAIALDNAHYTFEYDMQNTIPHLFLVSATVQ